MRLLSDCFVGKRLKRGAPGGAEKILAATAFLLLAIAMMASGGYAISLTGLEISPNPSSVFDYLTVTASGLDENMSGWWPYDGNSSDWVGGGNEGTWVCQSFDVPISADLNSIYLNGVKYNGGSGTNCVEEFMLFEYDSATTVGDTLMQVSMFSTFGGNLCPESTNVGMHDFNNQVHLIADTKYWACMNYDDAGVTAVSYGRDTSSIGKGYLTLINGGYPPDGLPSGGNDRSYKGAYSLDIILKYYNPTRLTVIEADGNYSTDYLCEGDFADANKNAYCSFANPCQAGNCTIKGKIYSEESGWSGEAQATITIGAAEVQANAGLPIYVMATSNFGEGLNEKIRLHSPNYFSARPGAAYAGQIEIDGEVTQTCNNTWDCQTSIGTGTHIYNLYSTIGSYKYSGVFTVDLNSLYVKIHVPLAYTIFDIFTDDSSQTLLNCSSIYSLTNTDGVGSAGKITTYVNVSNNMAFDSNKVIPRNCYSSAGNNINDMYPFAVPAPTNVSYADSTPADDELYPENGIWQKAYASLMAGISSQDREGYITKAILWEDTLQAYDGTFSKIYEQPGGYYSILTDFTHASMNEETYFLLDANYYPDSLAIGDNIYCEARLESHNFVINDVNILLVANGDTIIGNYSTALYKQFYNNMPGSTASSLSNMVYHKFWDVDPGAAAIIQCAFQTRNSLGVKSGWAFSYPRQMYASKTSAAGGINIFVKDEDGTTLYYRHKSQLTGDENSFDVISYEPTPDTFTTFNTSENPISLSSGDSYALSQDRNNTAMTWIAGKSFFVEIGGELDLTLYMPDTDSSDNYPVISNIRVEQSTQKAAFICSSEYYDVDLDSNNVRFNFWTDASGSSLSPICFKDGATYTTNCGLKDTSTYYSIPSNKCHAQEYQEYSTIGFYSECGSDNDCTAEASFEYVNCVPAGSLTGYCEIAVTDSNGNTAYNLSSVPIAPQAYSPHAECSIYNYPAIDDEIIPETYGRNLIYSELPNFVECEITVDEVLTPDFNFTAYFMGARLTYYKSVYNEFRGRTTRVFKGETTQEVASFLAENGYINSAISSTEKVWDSGDLIVQITHPLYGYFSGEVDAVLITGDTPVGDGGEYSEGNVDALYDLVDGLAMGMLTNPITTIQDNFFIFLLVVFLAIIFAPLAIMAALAQVKQGKQGG